MPDDPTPAPPSESTPGAASGSDSASAAAQASEAALAAAQAAIAQAQSQSQAPPAAPAGAAPAPFQAPSLAANDAEGDAKLDLLSDVQLHVKIELGRTKMLVEDVLRLAEGAVVELDKLAGDPVDVYVNDRPVARGEVLVLNDNFCVRISELLSNHGDAA